MFEYIYVDGMRAAIGQRQVSDCDSGRLGKITETKSYAALPNSVYDNGQTWEVKVRVN